MFSQCNDYYIVVMCRQCATLVLLLLRMWLADCLQMNPHQDHQFFAECIAKTSKEFFTTEHAILFSPPMSGLSNIEEEEDTDYLYHIYGIPESKVVSPNEGAKCWNAQGGDPPILLNCINTSFHPIEYFCKNRNQDNSYKLNFEGDQLVDSKILQYLHFEELWPITVKSYTNDWHRYSGEIYGHVMLVKKSDLKKNIEHFLNLLQYSESLSVENQVLVAVLDGWLSTDEVKEVFSEMFENQARYFIVLCQVDDEEINVYSWHTVKRNKYRQEIPHDIGVVATCNFNIGFKRESSLTESKNIYNMNGASFIMESRYFPPFTSEDYNGGMVLRLLTYIGRHMNCSKDIVEKGIHKDITAFRKNSDIEILVEHSHICSLHEMVRGNRVFYYALEYSWFTQTALPKNRWSSIFRVFAITNWCFIFLTLLTASLSFKLLDFLSTKYVLESLDREERNPRSLNANHMNKDSYLLDLWSVLLGMGVSKISQKSSIRILFVSWLLFSFALNTVYQTFVVSYFFDPGFEHQINTYEELKDLKYDLLFDSDPMLFYFMPIYSGTLYTPSVSRDAWKKVVKCIKYVINVPHSAALLSPDLYSYYLKEACKSEENVHLHKFTADSRQQNLMISVINPLLRNRIAILMSRLIEAGFPRKVMDEIIDPTGKSTVRMVWNPETEYIQLTVIHLQSIFALYLVGNILSMVIFTLELLSNNRHIRKWRKLKVNMN